MRRLSAFLIALSFALPVPAYAAIIGLHALLTGTQEVPPNASTATGDLDLFYDDVAKTFDMTLTVTGIARARLREGSGPNTTSIHIHRAPAGSNGPIEIDIGWYGEQAAFNPTPGNPSGWVDNPDGTIGLTLNDVPLHQDIQGLLNIADSTTLAVLENALYNKGLYINVHTCSAAPCTPTTSSPFAGGEIRGQIVPEPATLALIGLGLLGVGGMRRRSA